MSPGNTPPPLSPTAQAIWDARAQAKSSGQAVAVDALTTATSSTVVNPNGTLTTTDYTAPVRVQQGSSWVTIDPTLHTNSDGTLSPAAVPSALKLSGGGTGPLATMTTADGKQLSVTAPFALPTPTISGDTATYAGVLTSDVDLQVSALPDGGWRDIIVVKTAAAAANPALKSLHFPIATSGLSVSTGTGGTLRFTDSTGAVRMHAPTSLQWDSTPPPAATSAPSSTNHAISLSAAAPADVQGGSSTAQGPSDGANVAVIGVSADANGIDLTPDQNNLGKGNGPWFIDPSISADSPVQHWDQVQENLPDISNYDAQSPVGTGYCGYSDCSGWGRYRGYFQIGIKSDIYNQPSGAPSPPTVYNSTFYAQASDASSPSTSTPFDLFWTGAIDGNTTWNNQPCGTSGTMDGCPKIGTFWLTGTGPISFDVTSQMQQAAQQHWANWTVGIAPDDENNKYYRHHISITSGSAPHIVTNYDITPSAWWPRTTPTPGFASNPSLSNVCQTPGTTNPWDKPGWIGANQNITLTVSNWSPAGMGLHTQFNLFTNSSSVTMDSGWAGSSNSNVSVNVGSLTDGQVYGWHAAAYDADPTSSGLGSPWTPLCYFGVDKTPPNVSISSGDFPPSGSATQTTLFANESGKFTLHGTDPIPSGGAASGLACFRYSTVSTPVANWKCGGSDTVMADSNGNATFQYTPGQWGTNILYAWAQDNAGNYSQPAAYSFYAPWKIGSPAAFGSITADLKPSVLLPDPQGNLEIIDPQAKDPARAIAAVAGAAPGNATGQTPRFNWNDFQVTHRGTLSGAQQMDQLFAHNVVDSTEKGYLYLLNGAGDGTFPNQPFKINRPTQCILTLGGQPGNCPSNFTGDWSNVNQLLAIGTPEGEPNKLGLPNQPTMTMTSLLTVENGQLWLLSPSGNGLNQLSNIAQLIPNTSNTSWDQYHLIAPGPANGVTTDSAGNQHLQTTIWSQATDGTMHAYPITWNSTGSWVNTLTFNSAPGLRTSASSRIPPAAPSPAVVASAPATSR